MKLPIIIGVTIFLIPFIVGITIGLVLRRKKRRAIIATMDRIASELALVPVAPGKGSLQSSWHKGVIAGHTVFLQCRNLVYRGIGSAGNSRRNVGGVALRIVAEVKATRPCDGEIVRSYAQDEMRPTGARTRLEDFEQAFTARRGAEKLSSLVTNALLAFVRAHAGGLVLRDRAAIPPGALPPEIASATPVVLVHDVFLPHLDVDPVRPRLEAMAALAEVIARAVNPL